MTKIRVGLIGAGNWANYGHLPIMELLPDFEVTTIQARRREAAEAAADQFHIAHVVDTIEEVVSQDDVDLVLVLNTAPQHAHAIRLALQAGKHVYSEWPMTTSSATAAELLTVAEETGARHFIGLARRLAPVNRYIHDLVRDGYIGELRSVRLHVSMNYLQATRPRSLQWTARSEDFSSVGPIYGGHFFDMVFQALGYPESISAVLQNQFPVVTVAETGETIPTTAPDEVIVAGRFANGAVFTAQIEGGKRNGSGVQLDITGTAGDLRLTNESAFGGPGQDYVLEGSNGDDAPLELLPVPASYDWLPGSELSSSVRELGQLHTAVARDITTGSGTAPTFADGLWMHRFFDDMDRSDTGGVVVSAPAA